jgi:hypothetical protein
MVAQVQKITPFAMKKGSVVSKLVTVQDQNTAPDAKEGAVPIVPSQVQHTPSGMKEGDVSSLAVMHVPGAPSRVEDNVEPQSADMALQAAHEAIRNIKTLGGHSENVLSAARDVPADLETAANFQNTYLKPLRIFDSIIEEITEVRTLLPHQDRADPIP